VAAEAGGHAYHLDGEAARGQSLLCVPSASNIGLVVADVQCATGGEAGELRQTG
jgi:hypothetical protein